MPDVGSNQFRAAKGVNNFVEGIPYGKDGTTGGPNNDGWKYGIAVYAHNGTSWVEVWNAMPVAVSSSMATTGSGLTFSGTADPNNFSTTAKFEYKEVGGSYSNSGTTTTGMGDGVDGAVSFTVTATVANTYKNWEARASATNTAGTGTGSTVTLDCRKDDAGGSGWGTSDSSNSSTCDSCGTVITKTYTKSGCQPYSEVIQNCGSWNTIPNFNYGNLTLINGCEVAYDANIGTQGYDTGYYYTLCGGACTESCLYCKVGPQYIQQCSVTGNFRGAGNLNENKCYSLD